MPEHAIELTEREVCDRDLPGRRHDDEAFAGDVERVGLLDVTSQNEDQLIARAKTVRRIHRSAGIRVELRGWLREQVESEDERAVFWNASC